MAKHNERTLIEFQEEQEKVSEKYTFFKPKTAQKWQNIFL